MVMGLFLTFPLIGNINLVLKLFESFQSKGSFLGQCLNPVYLKPSYPHVRAFRISINCPMFADAMSDLLSVGPLMPRTERTVSIQ